MELQRGNEISLVNNHRSVVDDAMSWELHDGSSIETDGDDNWIYNNDQQKNLALDLLDGMEEDLAFCDVILETEDGPSIPAHRMVLAASSSYFESMFENFEERDQSRIKFDDVDHKSLELVVNYIYTGKLHVTVENVQHLLSASDLFQLWNVREACCDFLRAQLHQTNCWEVRFLGSLYGLSELVEEADSFIANHFW